MYLYRKLDEQGREELVEHRRQCGFPLHQPPRQEALTGTYLITAANFEHQHLMSSPARRDEWQDKIIACFAALEEAHLLAWCVLPNHYHLVAQVDLEEFSKRIHRSHNGTATQWNREDGTAGRKVWFRFCDRGIRSDRHLRVALNYVHFNAVKHGYVNDARLWPWSSLHQYLEEQGVATVRQAWKDYPLLDFGQGWDW